MGRTWICHRTVPGPERILRTQAVGTAPSRRQNPTNPRWNRPHIVVPGHRYSRIQYIEQYPLHDAISLAVVSPSERRAGMDEPARIEMVNVAGPALPGGRSGTCQDRAPQYQSAASYL